MDQKNDSVAGEQNDGQHTSRNAEQAGGIPRLPTQTQAAQAGGEGEARDDVQHPADKATPQQQTRLHAHRGQDGVRHRQRLEGTGARREGLRGVVALRTAKVRKLTFNAKMKEEAVRDKMLGEENTPKTSTRWNAILSS